MLRFRHFALAGQPAATQARSSVADCDGADAAAVIMPVRCFLGGHDVAETDDPSRDDDPPHQGGG